MEYDAEIFEKAVQFWYTGNYQDEDHHPPRTGVPELAWHMSARELRTALTPYGYRVTNDLELLGGTEEEEENDSDYQDEDEESESEEEEEEDAKSEDNESETSKDTEMGIPTALTTSIRVFVMAEQFGSPALKLVAKERFYRAVERELVNDLASPEFLACVDAIYTWPYATVDLTLLKEIVVTFIYTIYDDSFHLESPLTTTVRKHAELSYALLNYTLATFNQIPYLLR